MNGCIQPYKLVNDDVNGAFGEDEPFPLLTQTTVELSAFTGKIFVEQMIM